MSLVAGAAIGTVDKVWDPVTFATPEMVALFVGGVVFGLKKLWDATEEGRELKRQERVDRLREEWRCRKYGWIEAEVEFLEHEGQDDSAGLLKNFLESGVKYGLDPKEIMRRFEESEKLP